MKLRKLLAISFLSTASVHASQSSDIIMDLGTNLKREQKQSEWTYRLSIAKNENFNNSYRLNTAKILFNSMDPEIKILGVEAYMFLVKDETVDCSTRLCVIGCLFNSGDAENVKFAAQEYLSLAKDEKIDGWNRREYAKTLFNSTNAGIKALGVEALISIVKDKKVDGCYRCNCAEILFNSTDADIKALGVGAYVSIAKDEKVESIYRFHSAKILINSTDAEIKNFAEKVLVSIFKNEEESVDSRLEAAKILVTSTDAEIRSFAEKVLVSILKNEKESVKSHIEAAKILLNSTDDVTKSLAVEMVVSLVKAKENDAYCYPGALSILLNATDTKIRIVGAQECLSIVKDEMVNNLYRHQLADTLFCSGIQKIKELAIEAYLYIMKNEKTNTNKRLKIANSLLNSETFLSSTKTFLASTNLEIKKFVIGVYQSTNVSPLTFAQTLFAFPDLEIKKQGVQAYLFIIKDENVNFSERLKLAKSLFDSTIQEIKEQGAQAYLFIIKDKKVNFSERLKLAKSLFDSTIQEIKEQGVQAYLFIIKDEKANTSERLEIAKDLFTLSKPEIKNLVIDVCLRIIEDKKDPYHERVIAAEILFTSTDLELKKTVINIAEQSMITGNGWEDGVWARFIVRRLPEIDVLFQKALYRLCDIQSNKDGSYGVHDQLLKKIAQDIKFNSKTKKWKEGMVTFNLDQLQNPLKAGKLPEITYQDFLELAMGYSKELGLVKGEGADKEVSLFIERLGGESYFKNLFSSAKQMKENRVDSLVIKLLESLAAIQKLSMTAKEGGLSPRTEAFARFLELTSVTCPTGIAHGLHVFWNGITEQTTKLTLEQYSLLQMIENCMRQLRTDLLNAPDFIESVTRGEMKVEPMHQEVYVLSLLKKPLGLQFENEITNFDPNGGLVSKHLRTLTRQNVLDKFFEFYTPDYVIKQVRMFLFEKLIKEGDEGKSQLKEQIEGLGFKLKSHGKDRFQLDSEGTTDLLLTLGFLKEVKSALN